MPHKWTREEALHHAKRGGIASSLARYGKVVVEPHSNLARLAASLKAQAKSLQAPPDLFARACLARIRLIVKRLQLEAIIEAGNGADPCKMISLAKAAEAWSAQEAVLAGRAPTARARSRKDRSPISPPEPPRPVPRVPGSAPATSTQPSTSTPTTIDESTSILSAQGVPTPPTPIPPA